MTKLLEGVYLTDDEHAAVHMAGQLYNLLSKVVGQASSRECDMREVCAHVHAVQQAVMSNAAARVQ